MTTDWTPVFVLPNIRKRAFQGTAQQSCRAMDRVRMSGMDL